MRTLNKVKYTKGNKDLQSVNSEQDIELKVTNGEMQFSTDGTNFNKIVSYEVASINLDTAEDGLYLLKATSPTITYGNTSTTAEELNGAIVQRVFEAGFGTTAQIIKTNGEIQRYFKSYISGATWSVKTYITTPVTTITNNSTDYEVPSAKCVYDNFTQKGVPSGGTQGQVLTKDSDTDYDASWKTPSGGKLYLHNIRLDYYGANCQIYTNSSTPFNLSTMKSFISSIGSTSSSNKFNITSPTTRYDSHAISSAAGMYVANGNLIIEYARCIFAIENNDISITFTTSTVNVDAVVDTVTEI